MNSDRNLIEIDKQNIWHPFTQHQTVDEHIVISRAEGAWIYTEDGTPILDVVSSWWVNLYGHANPVVAKAIAEQASTLEHVIFAGFTHKPAVDLSENLLKILPSNQSKIFFSDNGSTAVEVGIKMALQFWFNAGKPKKKIVAISGSYHGDTFGAMAVGDRNAFTAPFDDLMFDVEFLDFPNGDNDEQVLADFKAKVSNKDVAAIVYEPLLQGTAGMRTYSVETLDSIIGIAHEHEVMCIADEVMTGFGRTGKYFASLHMKNQPDIVAMSKGITAGFLPMGVTSASQEIYEAFLSNDKMKTFFHGHSYTANPISCAAANAGIGLLTSDQVQSDLKRINENHKAFLESLKEDDMITKTCLIGTVMSIEIRQSDETSYFSSIRDFIYNEALKQNVLLRPLGNVVYLIPPYCITDEELKKAYGVIRSVLDKLRIPV